MQLTQHTPQIWTISDFLTQKECGYFAIFSGNKGYSEAEVSFVEGTKMMKGLRNNYRLLYEGVQLAADLWLKLAPFCLWNSLCYKDNSHLPTGKQQYFLPH